MNTGFFDSWVALWQQENVFYDIMLAHKVLASGKPNRFGCQIPVKSLWNLQLFQQLLENYHDAEVIQWLKYGFSVSHDDIGDPLPASTNHLGATMFPNSINEYLTTELAHQAMMGPFTIPPFMERIGISPLSTRPKKDSSNRRVILDLSFPWGRSVNDGIHKDFYCGEPIKLKYPTIDHLCRWITELGNTCLLYKCDLSCAFRLLPLCPRDYSLIGMRWDGYLFFDKVMPMGLRSAAFCCQRVTNAITHIHDQNGFWCINYLDDFGSAEPAHVAWHSFLALGALFQRLGAMEAMQKAQSPCHRMEFLGN